MSDEGALDLSTDMAPTSGAVEVDVPVADLWDVFARPRGWPTWNRCFTWVLNSSLEIDSHLIWAFEPIRPEYLYRMPAIARIVELEPQRRVTWEVTAFPGMYARHSYHLEPVGEGRTRFGSWEKAMGPGFRLARGFWLAHFAFVRDGSLHGARRLESLYRSQGSMAPLLRRIA